MSTFLLISVHVVVFRNYRNLKTQHGPETLDRKRRFSAQPLHIREIITTELSEMKTFTQFPFFFAKIDHNVEYIEYLRIQAETLQTFFSREKAVPLLNW